MGMEDHCLYVKELQTYYEIQQYNIEIAHLSEMKNILIKIKEYIGLYGDNVNDMIKAKLKQLTKNVENLEQYQTSNEENDGICSVFIIKDIIDAFLIDLNAGLTICEIKNEDEEDMSFSRDKRSITRADREKLIKLTDNIKSFQQTMYLRNKPFGKEIIYNVQQILKGSKTIILQF